jgi:cation transport regulator
MPYAANSDLPASVRAHLPAHAQDIFRAAFNHALTEYRDEGEEAAFRVAWSAVKRGYVKVGSEWSRKPKGA